MTESPKGPKKRFPEQMPWPYIGAAVLLALCMLAAALSRNTPPVLPESTEESTAVTESAPETEPAQTTLPTEAAGEAPVWNLLLVNPWQGLPEDFTVELAELSSGHAVDARIFDALQSMMADMRAEGLSPLICSSFRTREKQQSLYTKKVRSYLDQGYSLPEADREAGKWIAIPGRSEHQTGLALDIVDEHYPYLNEKQENTAAQKWLMAHSWQYGFILRYPGEKSDLTGISYEPWHYRYVGKDAAAEIFDRGICLEEYLSGES